MRVMFVIIMAALIASGCADSASNNPRQAPVCTFISDKGGSRVKVSYEQWLRALERQTQRSQEVQNSTGNQQGMSVSAQKQRALYQLIGDALWLTSARDAGHDLGQDQLDAHMKRQFAEMFLSDQDLMDEVLHLQGWNAQTWREHQRSVLAYDLLKLNETQARQLVDGLRGSCDVPKVSASGDVYPSQRTKYQLTSEDRTRIFAARPYDREQ